jgi:hypothetical protein
VSGQASSGGTVSSGGIFGGLFGGGTPKDLPQGYAAKDLSPLFRKVRISGVQINTRQVATAADTITIRENIGSGDGAINLTGMRIKGNQGNYAIQRGAKIYKTTGSALGNITLADGQSANIYAGTSAVSANFMGNSCMGYLMASYPFVPKIAGGTCTRPAKTEIATFSGACQDYILKLKTCETGNASDSRIPASDSACRSFVSNINYDGCVKTYQANTKFFSNVWHVWSGKSFLDPLHDQVLLLDANGKLVDYYLY